MQLRFYVTFLALFVAGTASAAAADAPPPISLTPEVAEYSLGGHVQRLHDRDARMRFDDVRSPDAEHRWETLQEPDQNYGFTSSAYWVRLRVDNREAMRADHVLVVRYPLIDYVDAYVEMPDGTFRHELSGDRRPYVDRELKHTRLVISMTTEPGQSQWIYLRMASESSLQTGIRLMTRNEFVAVATEEDTFRGIYYGIMLVMALYNFFLWVAIRSRSYLYYVLYVVTFGLTQMGLDGNSSRLLFPSWPEVANITTPLTIAVSQFWIVLFSQHFLELERLAPRLRKAALVLAGILAALVPLAIFAPYAFAIRIGAALAIVTSLACLTVGIVALLRGYRPARFYVGAWVMFIFGTLVLALLAFGVLPVNVVTSNGQLVGSAVEVTLLSFALGDKIKLLERDSQSARAEAIALERDLALTATVQHLFLPKEDTVDVGGVALAAYYRPATQCGGDWWWYERQPDGKVLVLLGDVTGHGAGAAMVTAAIAAAYRTMHGDSRPTEGVPSMLAELNRTFVAICGSSYRMSLSAVEVDPVGLRARLWSAGGPAAYVLRANGTVNVIAARGSLMGEAHEFVVGTAEHVLCAGDRIFLFSDGLPELVSPGGRQLGYRGVMKILQATEGKGIEDARTEICARLDLARGAERLHDDQTFVIADIRIDAGERQAA